MKVSAVRLAGGPRPLHPTVAERPISNIRRRYPRRAHIAVDDMKFEPPQTTLLTSDGPGLDSKLSVHREIVQATIEVQRCAKTLSANG